MCPNWACTDLCGGREVTRVPTAKVVGTRPNRREGPKPEVDAPKHPTFAADLPVFGRFETVRDSSTQASDVMLSSAALVSKICGDQIKELLLPGQDHLIFFELRLLMQDRT